MINRLMVLTNSWMISVIYELLNNNEIIGDINQDGTINILDVVSLVNIILFGTDESIPADLNNDGMVNILDIILLVNLILS